MYRYLIITVFLFFCSIVAKGESSGRDEKHEMPPQRVCIDVYDVNGVDVIPSFPGGDSAMMRFINNERRYPSQAYRQGVEGRVLCSFVVNEDGSISHVSVLKGVEESLDREAQRIILCMPRWLAGSIDDTPVPVYYILPIPFRL